MPDPSQMLPEDLANGGVLLTVDTLNGAPLQAGQGREGGGRPGHSFAACCVVCGSCLQGRRCGGPQVAGMPRIAAMQPPARPQSSNHSLRVTHAQVFASPQGIALRDGSQLTPDSIVVSANNVACSSVVDIVAAAVPMPF